MDDVRGGLVVHTLRSEERGVDARAAGDGSVLQRGSTARQVLPTGPQRRSSRLIRCGAPRDFVVKNGILRLELVYPCGEQSVGVEACAIG